MSRPADLRPRSASSTAPLSRRTRAGPAAALRPPVSGVRAETATGRGDRHRHDERGAGAAALQRGHRTGDRRPWLAGRRVTRPSGRPPHYAHARCTAGGHPPQAQRCRPRSAPARPCVRHRCNPDR
ncbi:MAG: hypothetical protein AVDCRST_MAG07-747 [uncultured Frankineae bacterium]|uniref:Uncharacterized protein n=1 Tax=uncultured Frankineae bacterium TaxID=437475 RepID=A0A6J4KWY6_9ACTN|nr:MAG: hypothetical protein AVDCRST_MAG07-747 [uncultured Frankineae bacterium]